MGSPGSDSFLVVPAGPLPGKAELPARASQSTFGMCTEEFCGEMKYLKLFGLKRGGRAAASLICAQF